ncbi:hypothetical protein G6F31_020734 [Rhizopus arrhizus]|nr:hypothetical protein G6F31_020734 [Rhizopus arrhizus]
MYRPHGAAAADSHVAHDVAIGTFHLDDVCTHIAEDLGGIRAHYYGRQVDDFDFRQRTSHDTPLRFLMVRWFFCYTEIGLGVRGPDRGTGFAAGHQMHF